MMNESAAAYEANSSNNSNESRRQPLNPTGNAAPSLNDKLNTTYIDIPAEDNSMFASLTRTVVDIVGNFVTPRQMLGVLRILKAVTLSFLVLTIAADLMYMCLLQYFSNDTIRAEVGGSRDTTIRLYGLILAVLSIGIEFDITRVTKNFLGLKGFVPRGLLLFFVATLTRAHPVASALARSANNNKQSSSSAYSGDDDVYGTDDDYTYKTQQAESELPYSSIVFQQVTSYVLGMCAFVYFAFGMLCFDRFTSKAFLSTKNPLVTTAIPQPNNGVAAPPVYRGPETSTTAYADGGSTYADGTTYGGSTYADGSTYPDRSTFRADSTTYSGDSSEMGQDP